MIRFGTADTKCTVMAFLEAVEELLAEGFVPPTDVYLASSCTEEWAGDGAPKLVKELQRRGIRLFLLCDEGGAIITEPVGGIHGNFAMVGVFEKGKADVKFTAKSIVDEAKVKGRAALYRVSEFLGIKNKLLNIRENVRGAIRTTDKDIAKTALLGKGLREAGQTAANAFRTFAVNFTCSFTSNTCDFICSHLVLSRSCASDNAFLALLTRVSSCISLIWFCILVSSSVMESIFFSSPST